jgi:hypothetical protein
MPQGEGSVKADGGPSLQGFPPPRPPWASAVAVRPVETLEPHNY